MSRALRARVPYAHVKNHAAANSTQKIFCVRNRPAVTVLRSTDTLSRGVCHFVTNRNAFTTKNGNRGLSNILDGPNRDAAPTLVIPISDIHAGTSVSYPT